MMRKCVWPVLIVCGLAMPLSACAFSPPGRYQPVVIEDHAGVPCFGIGDTREARRNGPVIATVLVTSVASKQAPLWKVTFAPEGANQRALPAGKCIAYGAEGSEPAPALERGEHYSVVMLGDILEPDKPAQTRWYSGNFCIVDVQGRPQVKQVPVEDGTVQWQQCGQ